MEETKQKAGAGGMVAAKLLSGRFFLCIIAGASMIALAILFCCLAWHDRGNEAVSPLNMGILGVLSSTISTCVTFYFTKRDKDAEGQ